MFHTLSTQIDYFPLVYKRHALQKSPEAVGRRLQETQYCFRFQHYENCEASILTSYQKLRHGWHARPLSFGF